MSKPSPAAFEESRAALEAHCDHVARTLSRDNSDWNGPDHLMISDLQCVIEGLAEAARDFSGLLNRTMDGALPIEKVAPF